MKGGKDDPQLLSKCKKRSRSSAVGTDTGTPTAGQRISPNGDQTATSGETTSGISSSANDGGLEASALAAGDAGSVNPLSVETQFTESPAGPVSSGSTTDTASEVASLIHSPGESSSVSTVDSSFDGRILKSAEDDAADDRGPLDDSKADLDNRLAVAAQVLACEDARSTVLNTSDSDHPTGVKTVDGIPLPDSNAVEGETSQKVNGQKCPPRFSTKVSISVLFCKKFLLVQISRCRPAMIFLGLR